MRFGLLSLLMLVVGALATLTLSLLHFGWGNPLAILGGLLIMFSVPVSLMLGVTGIIFDRSKWLAIVTTAVAGGLVSVYLYAMAINVF